MSTPEVPLIQRHDLPEFCYDLWNWVDHEVSKPRDMWLLRDFIMTAGVHIFAGPPTQSYKSYTIYSMMLALASGRTTCGLEPANPDGVPILLLQLESQALATARRFNALAKGLGTPRDSMKPIFTARQPGSWYLDRARDIDKICDIIATHDVKCIFVDTFAKSRSKGKENDNDDVGEVFRQVEKIRALDCSVVLTHHVKKFPLDKDPNDIDIDQLLRGGSAIAGAYDLTIGILPTEEQGTLRWVRRSNEAEEKEYKVTWVGCGQDATSLTLASWDESAKTGAALDRFIRQQMPGIAFSVKDLRKHVPVKDARELREIIDGLCISGVLETAGNGRFRRPE